MNIFYANSERKLIIILRIWDLNKFKTEINDILFGIYAYFFKDTILTFITELIINYNIFSFPLLNNHSLSTLSRTKQRYIFYYHCLGIKIRLSISL